MKHAYLHAPLLYGTLCWYGLTRSLVRCLAIWCVAKAFAIELPQWNVPFFKVLPSRLPCESIKGTTTKWRLMSPTERRWMQIMHIFWCHFTMKMCPENKAERKPRYGKGAFINDVPVWADCSNFIFWWCPSECIFLEMQSTTHNAESHSFDNNLQLMSANEWNYILREIRALACGWTLQRSQLQSHDPLIFFDKTSTQECNTSQLLSDLTGCK